MCRMFSLISLMKMQGRMTLPKVSKPKESNKDEIVLVRVSKEMKDLLEMEAKAMHMDKSKVMRSALELFLKRRINNVELAMDEMKRNYKAISKLDKKFEVLQMLVFCCYRNLLAKHPIEPAITDQDTNRQIEMTKNELRSMLAGMERGFMEQIVLDFLNEDGMDNDQ